MQAPEDHPPGDCPPASRGAGPTLKFGSRAQDAGPSDVGMMRRVFPDWLVRDPRGRLKRLRLRVTVTRPRTALQKRWLTRSAALAPADRALLRRTDSRIHPYEDMYTGDGSHYFSVALSAIRCIDAALTAANASPPQTILDMPCGFGRVTRALAARFPQAEITACDLRPRAVQFCAQRFGSEAAISSARLDEVALDRSFDPVWCGSLITHIDARQTLSLIDLFERSTAPGALIIFTTGGEAVAGAIKAGSDYKLAPEGQRSAVVRRNVNRTPGGVGSYSVQKSETRSPSPPSGRSEPIAISSSPS